MGNSPSLKRADRPDRSDLTDRSDRADLTDRSDRSDRADLTDLADRADRQLISGLAYERIQENKKFQILTDDINNLIYNIDLNSKIEIEKNKKSMRKWTMNDYKIVFACVILLIFFVVVILLILVGAVELQAWLEEI